MNTRETFVSVILLAGGIGSRMQTTVPKQFLSLKGKPIVLYSFELFLSLPEVTEIIVVCEAAYRHIFIHPHASIPIHYANPGKRRQDSVYNGLQQVSQNNALICVHDSARPLITPPLVKRVVQAANEYGAATVAMPVKATIRICNKENIISSTPDRHSLWEMQTPQVMRYTILREGFQKIIECTETVTDDVAVAEKAGYPVKIVEGAYSNIKITTPEDLLLADQLLEKHV